MSDVLHFFVMDGEEYLVLGHNPKLNNCLCLRIGHFHKADQTLLEEIARSDRAQREYYLLGILNREPYGINYSWWQYVAPSVFFMPLKHLKNRIADSQYRAFAEHDSVENSPIVTAETENIEEIIFGHVGRTLEV